MSATMDIAGKPTSGGHGLSILHPLIVRITHWVNAVAMVIMITSGWRIHQLLPDFAIPISWRPNARFGPAQRAAVALRGDVVPGHQRYDLYRLRDRFGTFSSQALADLPI